MFNISDVKSSIPVTQQNTSDNLHPAAPPLPITQLTNTPNKITIRPDTTASEYTAEKTPVTSRKKSPVDYENKKSTFLNTLAQLASSASENKNVNINNLNEFLNEIYMPLRADNTNNEILFTAQEIETTKELATSLINIIKDDDDEFNHTRGKLFLLYEQASTAQKKGNNLYQLSTSCYAVMSGKSLGVKIVKCYDTLPERLKPKFDDAIKTCRDWTEKALHTLEKLATGINSPAMDAVIHYNDYNETGLKFALVRRYLERLNVEAERNNLLWILHSVQKQESEEYYNGATMSAICNDNDKSATFKKVTINLDAVETFSSKTLARSLLYEMFHIIGNLPRAQDYIYIYDIVDLDAEKNEVERISRLFVEACHNPAITYDTIVANAEIFSKTTEENFVHIDKKSISVRLNHEAEPEEIEQTKRHWDQDRKVILLNCADYLSCLAIYLSTLSDAASLPSGDR